jgi:hypothetical protein
VGTDALNKADPGDNRTQTLDSYPPGQWICVETSTAKTRLPAGPLVLTRFLVFPFTIGEM